MPCSNADLRTAGEARGFDVSAPFIGVARGGLDTDCTFADDFNWFGIALFRSGARAGRSFFRGYYCPISFKHNEIPANGHDFALFAPNGYYGASNGRCQLNSGFVCHSVSNRVIFLYKFRRL